MQRETKRITYFDRWRFPSSRRREILDDSHERIQEFSSGGGGVQVSLTQKSSDKVLFMFFFSAQLIVQ